LAATLSGDQEVPPVASGATGDGTVSISADRSSIDFSLTVTGAFTSALQQAHIHVGGVGVNGPVILFLCSDLPDAPAGVQSCVSTLGAAGGQLSGTLTAADLVAQPGAATFDEAINAMIAGNTYMNVHTANNTGGEIRGQLGVIVTAAGATVRYVDNTNPGGDGSFASPFGTLAEAETASLADEIIFVFSGDGTDNGQNVGITLKPGQKLIGQGEGLAVNGTVIPPGAEPVISNAALGAGNNIPVVMLSTTTGNEVAGLAINATFNEGVLALSGSGHSVHDNTFAAPAREGVRLLAVTGNNSVMRNTMTTPGRAGIKLINIENQIGDPVVATAITATVALSGNNISGAARDGIDVTLDGVGTNVTVRIEDNVITGSAQDQGIDILGSTQANIAALVQGNDISASNLEDFRARANTGTLCLELIGNSNALNDSTFRVENNAGTFNFFEGVNDTAAVRIGGAITNVAQGTCVP
jgi:hypothetical protein